jgi:ribonuclease HII
MSKNISSDNRWHAGFDEVGRGCVAGPITICTAILNNNIPVLIKNTKGGWLKGINDSKQLKPNKREYYVENAIINDIKYILLSVNAITIDKYGIGVVLSALVAYCYKWLRSFGVDFELVVDGNIPKRELSLELLKDIADQNNIDIINDSRYLFSTSYTNITRADSSYTSVALASNIAKVHRDKIMNELNKLYPEFDWKSNKGYATKKHIEAIKNNDLNKFFRISWLTNIKTVDNQVL